MVEEWLPTEATEVIGDKEEDAGGGVLIGTCEHCVDPPVGCDNVIKELEGIAIESVIVVIAGEDKRVEQTGTVSVLL